MDPTPHVPAEQCLMLNDVARLIAATNQELAALVAARQFRADLFYRVNVFPIQLKRSTLQFRLRKLGLTRPGL